MPCGTPVDGIVGPRARRGSRRRNSTEALRRRVVGRAVAVDGDLRVLAPVVRDEDREAGRRVRRLQAGEERGRRDHEVAADRSVRRSRGLTRGNAAARRATLIGRTRRDDVALQVEDAVEIGRACRLRTAAFFAPIYTAERAARVERGPVAAGAAITTAVGAEAVTVTPARENQCTDRKRADCKQVARTHLFPSSARREV